jgi:hypothetical protein
MAKKKAVKKKPVKKTAQRKTKAARKTAKGQPTKKTTARKKATATKKATKKKAVKKAVKKVARKPAKKVVKKKGVRRATTTTGIRTKKAGRKLGRSRIPTDAPLDVVFQNDMSAREAFVFLGIHTMRELEQFEPDELVMRLTSPAKQTVGRIRKILAMNNRCLADDEAFALEFQERLSQTQIMK